ncbi:MAG: nucleoside transporter C-terminal domain-containing protein [Phycisphaeraceae bacterium]
MIYLRAAIGMCFFIGVAWGLSTRRKQFPWRVVVFGLALQLALAALILGTHGGRVVFQTISDGVARLLVVVVEPAAAMVFGELGKGDGQIGFVFAFAGRGLLAIIFFSALLAILYHIGVMQVIVWVLARIMTALMGVSGAESLAMAANIFVGQTEAPLVVRPYLQKMTMSELNALMTGGFATVAGSVLAIYIGLLGPEFGRHLLAASVMSAPAAFLIAKIILPETEHAETAGRVEFRIDRPAHNLIEAAANGTQDGLRLWLNVVAMLVAFTALIYLVDWPLGWFGQKLFQMAEGELSLSTLFGWVLSPVAWCMGVEGWHDCQRLGSLLGVKIAANEFVAFTQFAGISGAAEAVDLEQGAFGFAHLRSAKMAAYALCGFANFASIGIQIGGISALVPGRKTDLSRLALRAMIGGAFASWMTATIAGVFIR